MSNQICRPGCWLAGHLFQLQPASNDPSSFHLKLLIKDFYVPHLRSPPKVDNSGNIGALQNSKVGQHNFAMCACMKLFALRRHHTGFILIRQVRPVKIRAFIVHK